ncbi:MAG: hypothetical protein J5631_00705 [Spirochaetaceae bacterium]|nr:hypothetical protein [Spirochaetaceae bacterium]
MKEKLSVLTVVFSLLAIFYLFYIVYVSGNILKDIKYRSKHFIHHNGFYSYENGKFKLNDFENVSDYEIDYKIIFCIPFIGWKKGKILYKDVFASYKNEEIISGSKSELWYGRPNVIYIERKGLIWEITSIIDNPY